MVRISNMSTPSECNQNEFSQSACGFVVEFTDIITTHKMNDTVTNKGGWPGSQMKTFIDNDIYNSLPQELKSVIITTETVSGHGGEDTNNFTSTDKLYLLSTAEVWAQGTSNLINYDSARDKTRQLDYYTGVTTDAHDITIKKYQGEVTKWWLRSATSNHNDFFFDVDTTGDWNANASSNTNGVSPAFRLEGPVE